MTIANHYRARKGRSCVLHAARRRFVPGWAAILLGAAVLGAGLPAWRPLWAAPRILAVDPAASRIEVLLFREGLLSDFAHDHVLVAGELAGQVMVEDTAVESAVVRLRIPVAALFIDRPKDRERVGMAGTLSASNIEEIRANMLGAEQLDAMRYPAIEAESEQVAGELPDVTLTMRLRIRGVERRVTFPAKASLGSDGLSAVGEFELVQSDFGIEPFTLLLGAVAVADRVRVRFSLVAREP